MSSKFKVVIPARYGSTRLPGKPLLQINGKTMVRMVYENAIEAGAESVVVATDDKRIVDEIESFGGTAMMTSINHRSGTDRIAEVARTLQWQDEDVVVNLQGDEPGITPNLLAEVAESLIETPLAGISTLATPITSVEDLFNPNVVKTTLDDAGLALYFSRAPVPWVRDSFGSMEQTPGSLPDGIPFFRHLGLYAYRVKALYSIADASPGALEQAESLEQLRAMSLGIRIKVSILAEAPGHGVDTLEDLRRVERDLCK